MNSTSQPEAQIVLNVAASFGCMVVGGWLSCVVWGISCLQTFLYLSNYWDKDLWTKKGLVLFLWCVDTVNMILLLQPLWHVLIANFGDIEMLSQIQPALTHHTWIAAIVEISVQLFFIHRIYVFSGNRWLLPAFLTVLSLFQFIVLIPYDILTVSRASHTTAGIEKSWAVDMFISLRAVTASGDIIIAGTMIFLVLRHGLPQYRSTRRIVYRLIIVTFMTGFWTAVVAIVELALAAHFPTGLQFMIPEGPLCSLYFSSLLANLNSREYVKGEEFSCWNDSEIEAVSASQSKPKSESAGNRGTKVNRTGGMTFRVWSMGTKTTSSDDNGPSSGTLTVEAGAAQISESDIGGESLEEMQYKPGPEPHVHPV
ncbi:hypothetical protein DENSPDRAFT_434473 [Dentipellis sp. KUC8613]|nr:hypothetical protein DENSPDRAFT_434473 [Dentipellis sp. KUC8613]